MSAVLASSLFALALALAPGLVVLAPGSSSASRATSATVSVHGDAPLPLRRQLRAELRMLGFEVIETTSADQRATIGPSTPPSIELDADGRVARIRAWSAREGAVLERQVTPSVVRSDNDSDVRVAALQIVDVFQTLVAEAEDSAEVPLEPSDRPKPQAPPSSLARSAEPGPLGPWASAGPQWSPGGLPPGLHVDLGLAWRARSWLAPALVASLPVLARQRETDQGRVQAWPSTLALGPRLSLGPPTARVRFELLATAGVAWLFMRGDARPPYRGRRAHAVGPTVEARPGLSVRLGCCLRLRVDALVGGRWPRVTVGVVDRDVASLDPLVVGGSVGLELWSALRPSR